MRIESETEAGQFRVRLNRSISSLFIVASTGFLKNRKVLRTIVGVIGILLIFVGAIIFLTGSIDTLIGRVIIKISKSDAPFITLFGGAALLLAILATEKFTLYIGRPKEVEEREEAEAQASDSHDPYNSLDLAQKRLNEYYAINQSQARGSFRWAVFAMFVGLSTIVAGIWIFYLGDTPNTFLASLSTAAGVVVNTISGLYLYLHNKTQRRALFYYNQRVRVQNLGLAIRLAESHNDDTQKAEARNKVIGEILTVIRNTAIEEVKSLAAETN